MKIVGLDIGGANIKIADTDGSAKSLPFELWKTPERLAERLRDALTGFEPFDQAALTMTGELADCFATKREGVEHILAHTTASCSGRPVHVWQTGGEFVSTEVARDIYRLVAAANWHALATWIGRLVPQGNTLLIDVGSTTTDIIPLQDGIPVQRGMTDTERLMSGELVYSGCLRTPLAAVLQEVTLQSGPCRLAAEVFATMRDVYLVQGELEADPHDRHTADGRPATQGNSRQRLARMFCADTDELGDGQLEQLCQQAADAHRSVLAQALQTVLDRTPRPIQNLILSGSGRFLGRRICSTQPELADVEIIDLAEQFDQRWADAACACAVARLAEERLL